MTLMDLPPRHMWHPDRWTPTSQGDETFARPRVGQLIGWRYATWRVAEVTVRSDADLTDEDRKVIAGFKPDYQDQVRPYAIVLRHERGPVLVEHTQRLHDGTVTVHLGVRAGRHHRWHMMDERYAVCACCNHPYPCQEFAQERIAEAEGARLSRLLDSHAPGVCANCREPISSRQKTVSFPEPSLLVPGAPGPVYHFGRWSCRHAAGRYELEHRLPAFPGVQRLASCSGVMFRHEADGREECTAAELCTDLHGPKSGRDGMACYTRTYVNGVRGGYPRPLSDCGYRKNGGCLGAEVGPTRPVPPGIADLFGGQQ
ncbi:hypothetical protein MED01_002359 [Micromonospora sp. MED01]|uniref:hypothetical protein n=1 Tax=Micromonospora alfalfae TaxID=2911212 RepID=UPI001EE95975|nr:hypothetical protein [Micromonospora alfalfae]MCG5464194.1 hypothetical protein [Micromonospora alfalfae]